MVCVTFGALVDTLSCNMRSDNIARTEFGLPVRSRDSSSPWRSRIEALVVTRWHARSSFAISASVRWGRLAFVDKARDVAASVARARASFIFASLLASCWSPPAST
eukprot:1355572-Prymnesium_polylepis.1